MSNILPHLPSKVEVKPIMKDTAGIVDSINGNVWAVWTLDENLKLPVGKQLRVPISILRNYNYKDVIDRSLSTLYEKLGERPVYFFINGSQVQQKVFEIEYTSRIYSKPSFDKTDKGLRIDEDLYVEHDTK